MIKVECVSCKAPYELDERRIPEKGMKMRCPKCGTSFNVTRQGVSEGAAPSQAIAPPAAIAAPPPAAALAPPFAGGVPKGTMVGHQAMSAPIAPPAPAAKPAASPARPPMGTMVGPRVRSPDRPHNPRMRRPSLPLPRVPLARVVR